MQFQNNLGTDIAKKIRKRERKKVAKKEREKEPIPRIYFR